MAPRKYSELLPAPARSSEESSSTASAGPNGAQPELLQKKRIGTTLACTECRSRKRRCDGARPICGTCKDRGQTCVYVDNQRAANLATAEVLELLKSLPKRQSSDLLDILREMGDPSTVLSVFNDPMRAGSRRPKVYGTHDVGSSLSTLESELMAKNTVAYPSLIPLDASQLAKSLLLQPFREGVPSFQDPSLTTRDYPETQTGTSGMNPAETLPVDADSAIRRFRSPESPNQHAKGITYCDDRLHNLDISYWTDIDVTDDFAAQVISLYLQTDHPILGLFDPYLFIGDLIAKRDRFCSRLLVHSLLYIGCQMYTAFDASVVELSMQFSEEAKKLWECSGRDHVVVQYSMEAARMGINMGLSGDETTLDVTAMSDDELRAHCCAAWGVFNWNMLFALFYRQPTLECLTKIPNLPKPGDLKPVATSGDRSEDDETAAQNLVGGAFSALCDFWSIVHSAIGLYYPGSRDIPHERPRLEFAEYKFREIIAWAETLPASLIRDSRSTHHVVVFHIWLHCAILDIFRPFLFPTSGEDTHLKTFSADDGSAYTAYKSSVNQLKRLIVDYRTNYETSVYSILWHTGLLYLANAVLQDTEDPEWRLYFLLCIYGYEGLRRPYRVSEVIGKGLLSMTLRDTNMSGEDARRTLGDLEEHGFDQVKKSVEENVRATFMVDLQLAMTDPEKAKVESMADEFEGLAIFQDFVDREQMDDRWY